MSRHVLIVDTATHGEAMLVMGYDAHPTPHLFCQLADLMPGADEPLWTSLFSPEHRASQDPDDYDDAMLGFGVVIPDYIKQALREDWVKRPMGLECVWSSDGRCEQVR